MPVMTQVQPVEGVRCSDADRERTSARLRDAAAAGYLTMDETDERLTAAYAARYGHELDALVHDLPRARSFHGWPAVLPKVWMLLITGRRHRRLLIAAMAVAAVTGVALGAFEALDVFEGADDASDDAADDADDAAADDAADDGDDD